MDMSQHNVDKEAYLLCCLFYCLENVCRREDFLGKLKKIIIKNFILSLI